MDLKQKETETCENCFHNYKNVLCLKYNTLSMPFISDAWKKCNKKNELITETYKEEDIEWI